MNRKCCGFVGGLVLAAIVQSVAAQSNWTIVVNGERVSVATAEDGNRVMADARRLAEAMGALVEIDPASNEVRIVTSSMQAFGSPGEIGREYLVDTGTPQPYTFAYLGHEFTESRCIESSDGRGISRCANDETPVPMAMLRFKLGNAGDRSIALNRAFVDFEVTNESGVTARELNFWMRSDTRQADIGTLQPGEEVELLSVVDISDQPAIRDVVAILRGDRVLRFGGAGTGVVAGTGRGSPVPQGGHDVVVRVTGFDVNSETWDNALNLDGCGDEVYIDAVAELVRADGKTGVSTTRRSNILGDRNGYEDRIRAGRGDCPSLSPPIGGLKSQDKVDFEFVLYEGRLGANESLVIAPSIWEWDGSDASLIGYVNQVVNAYEATIREVENFHDWVKSVNPNVIIGKVDWMSFIPRMVDPQSGKTPLEIFGPDLLEGADRAVGEARDRPIGMQARGDDFVFEPQVLTIRGSGDPGDSSQSIGLRFRDADELRGDYTLHLEIVRTALADGASGGSSLPSNLPELDTGGVTGAAGTAPVDTPTTVSPSPRTPGLREPRDLPASVGASMDASGVPSTTEGSTESRQASVDASTPGAGTTVAENDEQAAGDRYRIVWKGFEVEEPTEDDPLQTDGKGDEVYYAALVFELTHGEPIRAPRLVKSRTMGDVNGFGSQRIRAGTASDTGGLVSGDMYPAAATAYVSEFKNEEPPFVIFEGSIRTNIDAVVIVPSLWEWDDNDVSFKQWQDWVTKVIPQLEPLMERTNPNNVITRYPGGQCGFLPVFSPLENITDRRPSQNMLFNIGDALIGTYSRESVDGAGAFIVNGYSVTVHPCGPHHMFEARTNRTTGKYRLFHQIEKY